MESLYVIVELAANLHHMGVKPFGRTLWFKSKQPWDMQDKDPNRTASRSTLYSTSGYERP